MEFHELEQKYSRDAYRDVLKITKYMIGLRLNADIYEKCIKKLRILEGPRNNGEKVESLFHLNLFGNIGNLKRRGPDIPQIGDIKSICWDKSLKSLLGPITIARITRGRTSLEDFVGKTQNLIIINTLKEGEDQRVFCDGYLKPTMAKEWKHLLRVAYNEAIRSVEEETNNVHINRDGKAIFYIKAPRGNMIRLPRRQVDISGEGLRVFFGSAEYDCDLGTDTLVNRCRDYLGMVKYPKMAQRLLSI